MALRDYLLRISLLTVAACVHLPRVAPQVRGIESRASSAVLVESNCGMWQPRSGSGVIISQRHVLTAVDIVGCASIPTVRVTYTDDEGVLQRLRMVVTDEDRTANIAKLEIASAQHFELAIRPPVVREPDPGNGVCANLVGNGQVCGVVASTWTVVKQMKTVGRDVGAPVYCDQGTLVGIVVNRGEGAFPYTWIAPVDAHWLADIIPRTPASNQAIGVARN